MLVSESPIEVGVSDPSRPDFPEYGYRFFQTSAFYTGTAGVSPQLYYISTGQPESRKYCKEHLINAGPATSLGDNTHTFFGVSDGLSPGNSGLNSTVAFSAVKTPTVIGKRPENRAKRGITGQAEAMRRQVSTNKNWQKPPHTLRNSAWTASLRPSTIAFWSLSTVSWVSVPSSSLNRRESVTLLRPGGMALPR